VIPSWEALADAYAWGVRAGAMPSERLWWWELRPHPSHGTLEVRVPDAQATVADAAAVVAVAQALVAWLAERWDAGEPLPVAETWRIEANRWSAARRGLDGTLADLVTGEPVPTRERLRAMLAAVAPTAERLGSGPWLHEAARLVDANGAVRQRMAAAGGGGARAVAAWLADAYLDGC
jgi:carboxylate-amine ligase